MAFPPDNPNSSDQFLEMSLSDLLAELPALTLAERQLLIRRAIELDGPELSPADEPLVEQRSENVSRIVSRLDSYLRHQGGPGGVQPPSRAVVVESSTAFGWRSRKSRWALLVGIK